MDTLQEKEAMQDLPFRDDGTIDLNEMMRRERCPWAHRGAPVLAEKDPPGFFGRSNPTQVPRTSRGHPGGAASAPR